MDTSRNICTILTSADLSEGNIKATVKTIEHNPNKFYLLQSGWQTKLWEVVEQLGKVSDDENTLTKMRIAYDLKFDLQTELKIGGDPYTNGTKVKSLADLLEILEFTESLLLNRADYHVIIDDATNPNAANQAVVKLYQQMVFLNLELDIQKKSEAKLVKVIGRPIRIAIMGTKKAGKSVIINSLLKRDYAPTSSLLPTPNTIKYIPAFPNSLLTLDYYSKRYVFDSAERLRIFIGKEYVQALRNTSYDSNLPDMTIYYPCNEPVSYEVWDTPEPNYAGATDEYLKNVTACIKEVDVCIFVMNYSNCLTNDEVTFLKRLNEILRAENKISQFIVVVNRIDERYAVDEDKSVNRILDYLSKRLGDLTPPYRNIVIFGTSALQSFYLDSVIDLVKADRAEDGKDVDELPLIEGDSIRPLQRRHKDALALIKFIYCELCKLEDFHDIENPTEKEIYAFSGIPQLRRYVEYLGEQSRRQH